ncbi:putative necrosis-inducing factor domain-containing protein [Hirsutella rhossiliensis]|uniref:Necrosis-inducing factor domain-containing protein n=1 Tax=Hirsutella rhossiliensis TaxID=111463 RepID=A0A9P8SCZ7_9HYPO|nr:putative necrosis-inducing factor domain-containing protein [Hirsutella rhossiliensis]KAH0958081.1 putative necrosis-inducing factor domain-containing protein [Hirsutella rhossiliensis]
MKLSLLPYAAVLASSGLGQAAPSSVIHSGLLEVLQPEDGAAVLEKRSEADSATFTLSKRGNECGDSTFIDQGSEASPLTSDCERLSSNVQNGGRWTLSGSQRTLATYGSCAFGASGGGPWYTYVGNEDIMDLIRDSIRKFRRGNDGKIGAKGSMHCSGNGGGGNVYWGIYHT